MKQLLPFLILLFFTAAQLPAQGICDSIISINPIQSLCAGTGEAYLNVSHPGGEFSGPGLIYGNSYLTAENLYGGIYTAKYTITGPGGCKVQATKTFEVLDALEIYPFVSGKIDCANPNSMVLVNAIPFGNYYTGSWSGPAYSNVSVHQNTFQTDFAGSYQYEAISMDPNQCPAYGFADVKFENNQNPINIENCTDCGAGWPQKIRIANSPQNWVTNVINPNGWGYYSPADASGCFAAIIHSGVWKVEALNPENGCKSTDAQYLDADNPTPIVGAGSNISIWCNGAGSFFSAMSPASGSIFNYFWTTPNGSTVPATNGGLLKATGPGAYILHGINTFSGCEDRDTAFAVVSPTPVSTQIAVICDGEDLFGYTQSGNYVDTILQANGCPKIRRLKLFKLAPLQDSIEITPDHGQMDGSIQYTVTQGWPPFVYNWNTGETSASISNLSAGTYTVSVTDANNCQHVREIEVPSNKPVRSLTKFRDAPILLQTKLYPNPVTAGLVQASLEINANQAGEAQLLINDVLGRNLCIRNLQIQEGNNVFSIAENLQEGVYILLIKGDLGTKEVSKLVVTGEIGSKKVIGAAMYGRSPNML